MESEVTRCAGWGQCKSQTCGEADCVLKQPYRPSADSTREAMIMAHRCPTVDEAFGCTICQQQVALAQARMRDLPLLDTEPTVSPVYQAKLDAQRAADPTSKPTNPKDAIGSNKVPMHLWPLTATAMGAMGLMDGALKYGRSNFREIGVRSTIYVDAAMRHLGYWFEGEDNDPDSGLPHMAHALACLAIVIDAQAAGKLNDDRNVRGGFRDLMTLLTPHVARLKELHQNKSPKHFTIADNPESE